MPHGLHRAASVNRALARRVAQATEPELGPLRRRPGLEALDTPVGRLAIVISKDAWMIDVNARFLAKGANVVLQPEAFSEWAYAAAPWQPDIFKEGGFANLEKNVPWWRTSTRA